MYVNYIATNDWALCRSSLQNDNGGFLNNEKQTKRRENVNMWQYTMRFDLPKDVVISTVVVRSASSLVNIVTLLTTPPFSYE